jgi:hypothetical protein
MRQSTRILWPLSILALVAFFGSTAGAAASDNDSGSIVIVFKDGHQHTFSMDEIARIDFNTPATRAAASSIGRGRFLGRWKVGDNMGGRFYITLNRDGSATKMLNAPYGTWTVVDGEARISWDDGWHDVLRLRGNRFEKAAYSPGTSLDEEPTGIDNAEHIERKPI